MSNKMKRMICRIMVVVIAIAIITTTFEQTHASSKTVVVGHEYDQGYEYQWLKTTETKDTVFKFVTNKWYWLDKNDQLFYYESAGNPTTITTTVGYGGASVGVTVPLGRKGGKGEGIAKTAKKKGYYRIKAKKNISICIRSTRIRTVDEKKRPTSKWGKPFTTKKTYTTNTVTTKLIRKK